MVVTIKIKLPQEKWIPSEQFFIPYYHYHHHYFDCTESIQVLIPNYYSHIPFRIISLWPGFSNTPALSSTPTSFCWLLYPYLFIVNGINEATIGNPITYCAVPLLLTGYHAAPIEIRYFPIPFPRRQKASPEIASPLITCLYSLTQPSCHQKYQQVSYIYVLNASWDIIYQLPAHLEH